MKKHLLSLAIGISAVLASCTSWAAGTSVNICAKPVKYFELTAGTNTILPSNDSDESDAPAIYNGIHANGGGQPVTVHCTYADNTAKQVPLPSTLNNCTIDSARNAICSN